MMNSDSNWRRQSSRFHWLIYANSPGCMLKYLVEGSYSHVESGAAVGASLMLEKVAFAGPAYEDLGRTVAYMGSKRKVSNSSRTISIMAADAARWPSELACCTDQEGKRFVLLTGPGRRAGGRVWGSDTEATKHWVARGGWRSIGETGQGGSDKKERGAGGEDLSELLNCKDGPGTRRRQHASLEWARHKVGRATRMANQKRRGRFSLM